MENLVIKTYTKKNEIKNACESALKNRLYVVRDGYCMKEDLLSAIHSYSLPSSITLAKNEGKVIGCAMTYGSGIELYVKKDFRRKGIGTKMIFSSEKALGKVLGSLGSGIKGSKEFFEKLGRW